MISPSGLKYIEYCVALIIVAGLSGCRSDAVKAPGSTTSELMPDRGSSVIGPSALIIACQQGELATARLLVSDHANLEERWQGLTALEWCACRHHPAVAEMLLDAGAQCHAPDGMSLPLCYACQHNDVDLAKRLIAAGADPKYSGDFSPIAFAASGDAPDTLELLLDNHADPDHGSPYPALCYAINNRNNYSVSLLIDHGANVGWRSADGETLLDLTDSADMAELLLKADPSLANINSPLAGAAATGNIPLLCTLLEHKADINLEGPSGLPLISAVENGQRTAGIILLAFGADPLQKDHFGQSALNVALACKSDLTDLLERRIKERTISPTTGRAP